jgi:hypothetical protein
LARVDELNVKLTVAHGAFQNHQQVLAGLVVEQPTITLGTDKSHAPAKPGPPAAKHVWTHLERRLVHRAVNRF